ncbi:MAG: glycosyltransferase [Flavobacteriaceae bacterium]|jgi:glycosyltransferase involved in cell wall biosynthesis|nr:glycosyltransferase [Flavobacteriaceae bacterium]
MIKLLFVNTDLRGGGAEKVLVNLVNSLDYSKYEVTVFTVFKEGINREYLNREIKQKWFFNKPFKGYSRLALLFSPKFLFKLFIKNKYDIIISYLEGFPSRIVSGCNNPNSLLLSWIHLELYQNTISYEFRNTKEAEKAYNRFDEIVCVANTVKDCFLKCLQIPEEKTNVIYNLLDIQDIKNKSLAFELPKIDKIRLCTVGRLNPQKGYDRLLRIVKKLFWNNRLDFELLILGMGPLELEFKEYIKKNELENIVKFLGYQENPYAYIKSSDLFVCSSYKEGYSTVVTESILLETPVITTDCSGMSEILDEGKSGIIVDNSEEALYEGLKKILTDKAELEHYKQKARERAAVLSNRNNIEIFNQFIEKSLSKKKFSLKF